MLATVGQRGIERTIQYSLLHGRPYHTEATEKVRNEADYQRVVTPERYAAYTRGEKLYPQTVLDHLYDKILHIKLPDWLENAYLRKEFASQETIIKDWVFAYWQQLV